ncbi:MAG: BrnA antitoxin family protein [Phycisphaerae bacterium]|nr:BrnA antitoxin family protein [Phycisphaerae bacterium]
MNRQLSDKQVALLKALAALPDELIDLSDIPEAKGNAWKNAMPGEFFRPIKKQVTIRLDSDVLAWLQSTGAGYQTRLNQLLRDAMRQSLQKAA